MITNRTALLGMWVAHKLNRPLLVNGKIVRTDAQTAQAIERRLGLGGTDGANTPALDVVADYAMAQRFAFWMATAARALGENGEKTGLLPSATGAAARTPAAEARQSASNDGRS